jgi:hypothetical protein
MSMNRRQLMSCLATGLVGLNPSRMKGVTPGLDEVLKMVPTGTVSIVHAKFPAGNPLERRGDLLSALCRLVFLPGPSFLPQVLRVGNPIGGVAGYMKCLRADKLGPWLFDGYCILRFDSPVRSRIDKILQQFGTSFSNANLGKVSESLEGVKWDFHMSMVDDKTFLIATQQDSLNLVLESKEPRSYWTDLPPVRGLLERLPKDVNLWAARIFTDQDSESPTNPRGHPHSELDFQDTKASALILFFKEQGRQMEILYQTFGSVRRMPFESIFDPYVTHRNDEGPGLYRIVVKPPSDTNSDAFTKFFVNVSAALGRGINI